MSAAQTVWKTLNQRRVLSSDGELGRAWESAAHLDLNMLASMMSATCRTFFRRANRELFAQGNLVVHSTEKEMT